MTIADLISKRADLRAAQLDLCDRIDAEKDEGRKAELEVEYERRDAELQGISKSIDRRQANAGADEQRTPDQGGELRRDQALPESRPADESRDAQIRQDEYRDAVNVYLRRGPEALTVEQRSALTAGTDADGGYAVPTEWGDLVNGLRDASPLRSIATVISGSHGGNFKFPRVANRLVIPSTGIIAEHAVSPDDAPDLTEVTLVTFTQRHMVKASVEFVQDSSFNVEQFVGSELGFELGLKSGNLYSNGTGAGAEADTQPQGLFPGLTAGVTNASLGYDQLIDLIHSVLAPYRANGRFVMGDPQAAAIRKLKDSNNRPLWEYGLKEGQPDMLLGYPITIDPYAPANGAAGTRPIAFGDIKRSLLIRDVVGIGIKRLEERFADQYQIAWHGVMRSGSVVRDQNAAKVFQKA